MNDHEGIGNPNNPNASHEPPIATTEPTPTAPPPPVIESPPISRAEHNDSIMLMRSVMDEVQ